MTQVRSITSEKAARSYVEGLSSRESFGKIEAYSGLLLRANSAQNLISKPSEAQIWQRHLADSAQLLEHVPRETLREGVPGPWLDLGSGPGLPGLVIAILLPDTPVILVESRARRVEFLEECVRELRLKNCTILGQRLERVQPFESWIISARAFAPLEKLLRLSAPFSTKATRYILPKGRSAAHELSGLKPSIRKLFHVKQSRTDPEAGIIVSA